ncbi:hypothetical protein H0S58_02045 [Acinetobacter sp. TTH0-4]|uniref:hypothetical protein n=1 Tax=Acinetobacter sp. TTH0-4 TaxID=1646498 RepID=UPI00189FDBD7|nr:hypothetical protein [Acinetobacter sp. TTH0-4]QPF38337.1 hypothetical protein H0S58_02045 [Acinetobacter sp. TTH0-4]
MYQPISKIVCVLALCCTTPLYANHATDCKEVKFQATDQAWTGHYYLQGVMEVGSELLLQDHGKFKWYLAVGSLDQYAEGTWWKNGNCIGLKALPKYTKQLEIFPTRLKISDAHLMVTWMDGSHQGHYIRATP